MENDILNIVNTKDEIIGEETRGIIHRDGLLHREVHVYFVTPDKKVILQHRAKDKDTYPDMWDATVGGHVELGESYIAAAIKETKEETDWDLEADELIAIDKLSTRSEDTKTGLINNSMKTEFIYFFKGSIDDLQTEEGMALGFGAWSIEEMKNMKDAEREKFIIYCYDFIINNIDRYLKN